MQYEVAVAGGGIMGLSAAYALLKRGVGPVVVLERHSVGHDRAASADNTKAIRYEYAESAMYSHMVHASIEMWRQLEHETGADLYENCGVVTWGRGDANHVRASYLTVSGLGLDIPIREVSPEELCCVYPQFHRADMTYATISPAGGFMRPWNCLAALSKRIRQRGGEIREGAGLVSLSSVEDGVRLRLESGEEVEAARLIITAGAWSSTLMPRLGLTLPVTANKQQVVYISGLGQEFAPGPFPVFLNLEHDFYGFPLDQNGLFKASVHVPGPIVDPDVPHPPDDAFVEHIMALLRTYIPGAAHGKIEMSRVCMYAMTPDEDFYIDRFPGHDRVVFGAGFSGHGFKFGILIGDMLAALSLGEEPRFSLQTFSLARSNRAV